VKNAFSRLVVVALLLPTARVLATPSTTYWAPSTTYVQPYLVPHVTYDTYFGKGPAPGAGETSAGPVQNSPIYPVTTGLTMGVLPWGKLQLEVGFDLLLPSPHPAVFNAKLGTPEGTFFRGSPSLAVGVFGVGTKTGVTDFDILYGQLQKNLPWGGFVSGGGYYGAGSTSLWIGSDGGVHRAGFMGAIAGPDIDVRVPGLKKIVPVADVQTGKNVFGAGGAGLYFYFTDAIDVLTGPVFFFDKALQPGGRNFLWTVQLDVDVTLIALKAKPAPAAAGR
jgi:hypothetical protein